MALGILTKKCETLLASSFTATDFSHLSNGFKELDGYGYGPAAGEAMSTSFLNYITNATIPGRHSTKRILFQRRRDEATGDGERLQDARAASVGQVGSRNRGLPEGGQLQHSGGARAHGERDDADDAALGPLRRHHARSLSAALRVRRAERGHLEGGAVLRSRKEQHTSDLQRCGCGRGPNRLRG